MDRPKFSLIVPTYNRAYVLWKAILAVKNQTCNDWELLIVDDGSTDDTNKLMAEFQDDKRIEYLFQQNQGPAAARNKGLSKAKGEIVVYIDSDDEVYPHLLKTIDYCLSGQPDKHFGLCNHNRSVELLDEIFKTKAVKIEPSPQNQSVTLQNLYDWETKTTSTGLFHRRELFAGKAAWKGGIYIEDLEFIMQLAVLNEQGFLHIPQSLFHYRQKYGGDGLCSQASYETWAHTFGTIYEWHKNDPLMKNPDVYLSRVKKYRDLQGQFFAGKTTPQSYKYFPEFWEA